MTMALTRPADQMAHEHAATLINLLSQLVPTQTGFEHAPDEIHDLFSAALPVCQRWSARENLQPHSHRSPMPIALLRSRCSNQLARYSFTQRSTLNFGN